MYPLISYTVLIDYKIDMFKCFTTISCNTYVGIYWPTVSIVQDTVHIIIFNNFTTLHVYQFKVEIYVERMVSNLISNIIIYKELNTSFTFVNML